MVPAVIPAGCSLPTLAMSEIMSLPNSNGSASEMSKSSATSVPAGSGPRRERTLVDD